MTKQSTNLNEALAEVNARAAMLDTRERGLTMSMAAREARLQANCEAFFAQNRADLARKSAEAEAALKSREQAVAQRERAVEAEERRAQRLKQDAIKRLNEAVA